MCIITLTPNKITNLKRMNENIESNYVKDVTTPNGCPEMRSKYTGEHTDKFQLHLPPAMQLLKNNNKQQNNNNKQLTCKQQPGMESGDGGWGAMWAVTPPMNECLGVF